MKLYNVTYFDRNENLTYTSFRALDMDDALGIALRMAKRNQWTLDTVLRGNS